MLLHSHLNSRPFAQVQAYGTGVALPPLVLFQQRPWIPFILAASSCVALATRAEADPPTDPVLAKLIAESLGSRPEIASAQAQVEAMQARVSQASAWSDPQLQFGVQNDSFTSWTVGAVPISFFRIMVSQTFPWPGKNGLREARAEFAVQEGREFTSRVRLATEAEVRRSYIRLLLARGRLALTKRLETLWNKSAAAARALYEAGGGSQAEILRARLAIARLKQRELSLVSKERNQGEALNRSANRSLDAPIVTPIHLVDLAKPTVGDPQRQLSDAVERSPELLAVVASEHSADSSRDLAKRERYPDITVSAAVMPRGGPLPTMWSLAVATNLPIFATSKQNRAVDEAVALAAAARAKQETIRQLLQLRVRQRYTAATALAEMLRSYESNLLVTSRATADSALAQYEVGRGSFALVFEGLAGVLEDEDAYLQLLADAQLLAIDSLAVSLEAPALSETGSQMTGRGSGNAGAMQQVGM